VDGTVRAQIGDIALSTPVHLGAHESSRVVMAPQDHPELNIAHPKLWWPYPLGPQNLYRLRLEFVAGGVVSDRQDVSFGIPRIHFRAGRERASAVQDQWQNILIRGVGMDAGYAAALLTGARGE